jgi:hypothetical protein
MFSLILLLLAQTSVASPASADGILVIGHRAEKELATCLARNCPPAEEVEASLQASVEQFADGRYVDARHTLQSAIRRNQKYAADLPGPVSSLYATLATVAEHEGDTRLWLTSARNNVLVLRRYVGKGNLATLREELSFGDSMVELGSPLAAEKAYATAQGRAIESGQPIIAAHAAFRRGWLALMRDHFSEAERYADQAVALAGANSRTMEDLRAILRVRIAARKGDAGAVDLLATRLRRSATRPPQLLFAPPVEDINLAPSDAMNTQVNPWHDSGIRFADVGYWIRPNGRTAEAEVLRTSGLGQWAPGILRQVRARRYVPLDVEPGDPGLYRIDRFTVRAGMGVPIGTRIQQRTGNLTIHVIDLTQTEAMSAAHRRQTEEGSKSATEAGETARTSGQGGELMNENDRPPPISAAAP